MFWKKAPRAIKPKPKEEEVTSIYLYASDDLLTRAKNIVYLMGKRGAVGDYVLTVYEALKKYEALDENKRKQQCQTTDTGKATSTE